jgi:hypothetical protein
MPKKTYTQINSITLAAASSSVTFSSIPHNFRDLICVITGQFTGSFGSGFRFNSDTGTNYSNIMMRTNSPSESGTETAGTFYGSWSGASASAPYQVVFQVFDYSASDKHKTALWRAGYTDAASAIRAEAFAGRWANISPVNTVTINSSTNGFATGFTFTLYGIEA